MQGQQRQDLVEALNAHRAIFTPRQRRSRSFMDKQEHELMWTIQDFDEAQRHDPAFIGPTRPFGKGYLNGKPIGFFMTRKAFYEKLNTL